SLKRDGFKRSDSIAALGQERDECVIGQRAKIDDDGRAKRLEGRFELVPIARIDGTVQADTLDGVERIGGAINETGAARAGDRADGLTGITLGRGLAKCTG